MDLQLRPSQDWDEIEDEDDDMLVALEIPRLREEFFNYLDTHRLTIEFLVKKHLRLMQHQRCLIAHRDEWIAGSFNVCIPIAISQWRPQRLMFRCSFPHMLSERNNIESDLCDPGVDEKVRCEAATYAWISQHCKQVPIPQLWGFGLPSGLGFTPISKLPWYLQALHRIKSAWAWLRGRTRFSPYFPQRMETTLKSGYLIVDYIEKTQGVMLSSVWPPKSDRQMQNFYRTLSRIMLNLISQPLEKIGSFTVNNNGEVSLSNRPLTLRLPILRSEGIPEVIPRHRTYDTTESYVRDLLAYVDAKFIHQPNSVRDKYDAEGQIAVFAALKLISSHFITSNNESRLFGYRWTDDHSSNIFVDRYYNVVCLPDLEWFHASPLECLHPPFWLSGHALDRLGGENSNDYDRVSHEFLKVFEKEELSLNGSSFHSTIMKTTLEKKVPYFWAALHHPRATNGLFLNHLQPIFAPSHSETPEAIQFQRIVAPYWSPKTSQIIIQKLSDREAYLDELRKKHGR